MTQNRKRYGYLIFLALPILAGIAGFLLSNNRSSTDFLAGLEPPTESKETYLQGALVALRAEDSAEAIHQLGHFLQLASDDERASVEEFTDLIDSGELAVVEQDLEALIRAQGGLLSRITDAEIEAGQQLFTANGCNACHGDNAEGSDIAPALPGHSIDQVRRQVRAPIGVMPPFPPVQVSNTDLDNMAAYIANLPGTHIHLTTGEPLARERMMLYYWTAFAAIGEDDRLGAIEQIQQVERLVTAQHLVRVQELLEHLQAGDTSAATEILGETFAGIDPPDLTTDELYLQLARWSLRADALNEAARHLEFVIARTDGEQREAVEAALDLLEQQRLIDAERAITALLP